MSFNSNDINKTINLGNYEEFFILYMDNELTPEQKAMVDAFLLAHPDLQSEFDLIKSLQLQPDTISFNKETLLADQMKVNVVEEDLLLYIDNELPAELSKELEAQIRSDKNIELQHKLLLQTKLDASENIVYPNKQELYRREERTVRLGMWMRVAAAVAVVATLGVFYFNANTNTSSVSIPQTVANNPVKIEEVKDKGAIAVPLDEPQKELLANNKEEKKNDVNGSNQNVEQSLVKQERKTQSKHEVVVPVSDEKDVIAYNDGFDRNTSVDANPIVTTASISSGNNNNFINSSPVTSDLLPRNTITTASQTSKPVDGGVADNKKGSLKGLLRKATRVLEQRTGIEATNDDDELMIGALTVKLK